MCDLAYVIQVEQLERRVLADRQALIAGGVREGLPVFDTEQATFDEWLASEPQEREPMSVADLEQLELQAALGVLK